MGMRIRIASRNATPVLQKALTAVASVRIGKSTEQICEVSLGPQHNVRCKKQRNLNFTRIL
jgi:hypothetical protein